MGKVVWHCIYYRNPLIASSEDGKMFICWHPEVTFPYECSRVSFALLLVVVYIKGIV